MTGPESIGLEHVDAVLAALIIREREIRPFNPLEQVAVDAIMAVSAGDPMGGPVARELMARFVRERWAAIESAS